MKQTKTKVHEDSVCHNLAKSGQGGPGSHPAVSMTSSVSTLAA